MEKKISTVHILFAYHTEQQQQSMQRDVLMRATFQSEQAKIISDVII
jgi:hypothetical protein